LIIEQDNRLSGKPACTYQASEVKGKAKNLLNRAGKTAYNPHLEIFHMASNR
jgi:hypothetical protein